MCSCVNIVAGIGGNFFRSKVQEQRNVLAPQLGPNGRFQTIGYQRVRI